MSRQMMKYCKLRHSKLGLQDIDEVLHSSMRLYGHVDFSSTQAKHSCTEKIMQAKEIMR